MSHVRSIDKSLELSLHLHHHLKLFECHSITLNSHTTTTCQQNHLQQNDYGGHTHVVAHYFCLPNLKFARFFNPFDSMQCYGMGLQSKKLRDAIINILYIRVPSSILYAKKTPTRQGPYCCPIHLHTPKTVPKLQQEVLTPSPSLQPLR